MGIAAFLIIPLLGNPIQDSRSPIPSDMDQARAEISIRNIFGDTFAKTDATSRKNFAKRLILLALETKGDTPSRFVYLSNAADLAALAGDPKTAFSAMDHLTRMFQLDPEVTIVALFERLKSHITTLEGYQVLADRCFRWADEELSADRYSQARRAVQTAIGMAVLAKDVRLVVFLEGKLKSIESGLKSFESAQKAENVIASNPNDPVANLVLGSHLCHILGQWEKGLPFLSKGSDGNLSFLAKTDLANPEESKEQARIAGEWRAMGVLEKDPWKRNRILERARHWYQRSLAQADPSAKPDLETRISEIDDVAFRVDPVSTRLPTEGLVAWWKLDEGEGDEAKDSSSNQNHGLLRGPDWEKGKLKGALRFNGMDNFVWVSPAPYMRVTTNFTMALWAQPLPSAKPGGGGGGYAIFPSHGQESYGSTDHLGAGIWVSTKGVGVVEHTASYIQPRANYKKDLTGWTHVAVVYENSQPKIYINGRFATSGQRSERIVHPGCFLGEWNAKALYGAYSGLLEDVRIYDRVLSDFEIRSLASQ